ncbi:hypothetical protein Poli38472_011704 [Pythium oligandrum]|uniref:Uncharacterized protein n=1 Tax=Pythium oligandrum TaxID=41045 RepID=A0A8K1C7K3_PYTOL|nr:hypothetical protein Poli38472_011704 [Pythium oligandrum]|eukprot:TMW58116.1 hypothetical protein Poli38472_011704 [Pythium oligandrum]
MMAMTDMQNKPAGEDQGAMEDKKKQLREAVEATMEEDEEEDETFLALQKLLRALNSSRANVIAPPARSGPSATDSQEINAPQSPEGLLETRRQERERVRRSLQASKDNQQYPTYYYEDDEGEEGLSAESQISSRVISVKQLPFVLLPKGGKVVSPAENPKLNIIFSREREELSDQLVAALDKLDSENVSEQTHLLTPPRSTWTIQMRRFDDSAPSL